MQRERRRLGRREPQRGFEIGGCGVDARSLEPGGCTLREEIRVGGCRCGLVRPRQRSIENSRVVPRPTHEVDRFPQRLRARCLPGACHGDLSARNAEVAGGRAHGDLAFEHYHLCLRFAVIDANVEFGALETRIRVWRRELQRTRVATDHVDRSTHQVDQRCAGLFRLDQRDRRVLVEAQGAVVGKCQRRAAGCLDADRIAVAKGSAARGLGPNRLAGAFDVYSAFDHRELRVPLGARGVGSGGRWRNQPQRQRENRKCRRAT